MIQFFDYFYELIDSKLARCAYLYVDDDTIRIMHGPCYLASWVIEVVHSCEMKQVVENGKITYNIYSQ